MDDKRSMKEKGKFTIDELVLCYEPDPMKAKVLYDAKVGANCLNLSYFYLKYSLHPRTLMED